MMTLILIIFSFFLFLYILQLSEAFLIITSAILPLDLRFLFLSDSFDKPFPYFHG